LVELSNWDEDVNHRISSVTPPSPSLEYRGKHARIDMQVAMLRSQATLRAQARASELEVENSALRTLLEQAEITPSIRSEQATSTVSAEPSTIDTANGAGLQQEHQESGDTPNGADLEQGGE
jgi:hypothetical protein